MKGVTISALSALDIALWDIKGKSQGLPIFKLLGGAYRHKARAYATGLYEPQNVPNVIEALVNEALGYKEEGFSGMKLKVGYGIDKDVSYVKAIRQAIGEEIYLMVDANHAYNSSEAIQLARKLERFDIHWFEEPVPPISSLREGNVSIPDMVFEISLIFAPWIFSSRTFALQAVLPK
jgi:D-galactarolactone cycloisomerase